MTRPMPAIDFRICLAFILKLKTSALYIEIETTNRLIIPEERFDGPYELTLISTIDNRMMYKCTFAKQLDNEDFPIYDILFCKS